MGSVTWGQPILGGERQPWDKIGAYSERKGLGEVRVSPTCIFRISSPACLYLQVLHLVLLQGPQRVELGQASLLQGRELIFGHPVQGHKVAPVAVIQGALQH